MGTATCRSLALAALVVVVGGCGGSSHKTTAASPPAFAWLRPSAAPGGWRVAVLPSGATIALPRGWERIHGDSGTVTAALLGPHGAFLGYLNVTPQQGDETLANWTQFRVEHNGEEGDTGVVAEASTTARRVGNESVSCVKDSYGTKIGAHYTELACLIRGPRTTVVAVGASPPSRWAQISPTLERALDSARA